MGAKDKTASRQYWFNSHSSFSNFFYPLNHVLNYYFFSSWKQENWSHACSFVLYCLLITSHPEIQVLSYELSGVKPSQTKPFWKFKTNCSFSQAPSYCRSKVLCFWTVVSDVRWKSIQQLTQQIPLFWSVTSFFLKQWIPVIKWMENVS